MHKNFFLKNNWSKNSIVSNLLLNLIFFNFLGRQPPLSECAFDLLVWTAPGLRIGPFFAALYWPLWMAVHTHRSNHCPRKCPHCCSSIWRVWKLKWLFGNIKLWGIKLIHVEFNLWCHRYGVYPDTEWYWTLNLIRVCASLLTNNLNKRVQDKIISLILLFLENEKDIASFFKKLTETFFMTNEQFEEAREQILCCSPLV